MIHTKPKPTIEGRQGERMVELPDGTLVSNYSEEYRHHCEALAVIRMVSKGDRRRYIRGELDQNGVLQGGVQDKRGKAAADRLENTVRQLWYLRVNRR